MSDQSQQDTVLSPCISVCALNEDDICIGCWRSGEEITQWWSLDDDGRRRILAAVAERQRADSQPKP